MSRGKHKELKPIEINIKNFRNIAARIDEGYLVNAEVIKNLGRLSIFSYTELNSNNLFIARDRPGNRDYFLFSEDSILKSNCITFPVELASYKFAAVKNSIKSENIIKIIYSETEIVRRELTDIFTKSIFVPIDCVLEKCLFEPAFWMTQKIDSYNHRTRQYSGTINDEIYIEIIAKYAYENLFKKKRKPGGKPPYAV